MNRPPMHITQLQHLLPQRLLCRWIGRLAESRMGLARHPMINLFRWLYRIDLSECTRTQPGEYQSFNDFFTRQLRADARPIDSRAGTVVSPVDGTFACVGRIEASRLLQAKRHHYRLEELLVDETMSQNYVNGHFATLYLAPYNYHRVHIPLESKIRSLRYVPGKQFSVNTISARHIPGIYARNERLVAEFTSPWGNYCLIMVGALLVAGMSTVLTGPLQRRENPVSLPIPKDAEGFPRGAEFGTFHMGSTVILLFPEGMVEWHGDAQEGNTLRFGEMIGNLKTERPARA